jgi:hypothetical protein
VDLCFAFYAAFGAYAVVSVAWVEHTLLIQRCSCCMHRVKSCAGECRQVTSPIARLLLYCRSNSCSNALLDATFASLRIAHALYALHHQAP